eukprot:ANDGO_00121.mRNA.1 hypothetical protein
MSSDLPVLGPSLSPEARDPVPPASKPADSNSNNNNNNNNSSGSGSGSGGSSSSSPDGGGSSGTSRRIGRLEKSPSSVHFRDKPHSSRLHVPGDQPAASASGSTSSTDENEEDRLSSLSVGSSGVSGEQDDDDHLNLESDSDDQSLDRRHPALRKRRSGSQHGSPAMSRRSSYGRQASSKSLISELEFDLETVASLEDSADLDDLVERTSSPRAHSGGSVSVRSASSRALSPVASFASRGNQQRRLKGDERIEKDLIAAADSIRAVAASVLFTDQQSQTELQVNDEEKNGNKVVQVTEIVLTGNGLEIVEHGRTSALSERGLKNADGGKDDTDDRREPRPPTHSKPAFVPAGRPLSARNSGLHSRKQSILDYERPTSASRRPGKPALTDLQKMTAIVAKSCPSVKAPAPRRRKYIRMVSPPKQQNRSQSPPSICPVCHQVSPQKQGASPPNRPASARMSREHFQPVAAIARPQPTRLEERVTSCSDDDFELDGQPAAPMNAPDAAKKQTSHGTHVANDQNEDAGIIDLDDDTASVSSENVMNAATASSGKPQDAVSPQASLHFENAENRPPLPRPHSSHGVSLEREDSWERRLKKGRPESARPSQRVPILVLSNITMQHAKMSNSRPSSATRRSDGMLNFACAANPVHGHGHSSFRQSETEHPGRLVGLGEGVAVHPLQHSSARSHRPVSARSETLSQSASYIGPLHSRGSSAMSFRGNLDVAQLETHSTASFFENHDIRHLIHVSDDESLGNFDGLPGDEESSDSSDGGLSRHDPFGLSNKKRREMPLSPEHALNKEHRKLSRAIARTRRYDASVHIRLAALEQSMLTESDPNRRILYAVERVSLLKLRFGERHRAVARAQLALAECYLAAGMALQTLGHAKQAADVFQRYSNLDRRSEYARDSGAESSGDEYFLHGDRKILRYGKHENFNMMMPVVATTMAMAHLLLGKHSQAASLLENARLDILSSIPGHPTALVGSFTPMTLEQHNENADSSDWRSHMTKAQYRALFPVLLALGKVYLAMESPNLASDVLTEALGISFLHLRRGSAASSDSTVSLDQGGPAHPPNVEEIGESERESEMLETASLYTMLGRVRSLDPKTMPEAIEFFRAAAAIYMELHRDLETAELHHKIASLYSDAGAHAQAAVFAQSSLDTFVRILGNADSKTIAVSLTLAFALVQCSQFDGARQILVSVVVSLRSAVEEESMHASVSVSALPTRATRPTRPALHGEGTSSLSMTRRPCSPRRQPASGSSPSAKHMQLADTLKLLGSVHLALGDQISSVNALCLAARSYASIYGPLHMNTRMIASKVNQLFQSGALEADTISRCRQMLREAGVATLPA